MRFRFAALLALPLLTAGSPASAFDGWHQERAVIVEGPGSAWDYVSLDSAAGHLFIGHRAQGLQVFDVRAGKLLATVAGTQAASANGATLMPEFDLGIANNENGSLIPFALSTLAARPAIKLGEELDTSHYDGFTKRIVVNMAAGKDGTEVVVLQAPSLEVVGRIRLPAQKLEGADGDGKGGFWIAARDRDRLFRLDTKALTVTAELPTPGCAQTNSVAVDAAHDRIFIGCRGNDTLKPAFAVMNASSGKIVFSAEIGGGNDSVVFDPELKRIFLANGVGAMINVFEQVDADTYRAVETLGTRAGMRTMVIDPVTKKLHAVVGEGSADAGKKINTATSPFYANSFFKDGFSVVTYAR